MFQGQVKSKNSRSNKKIRYFVINFSQFVSSCPWDCFVILQIITAGRLTKQAGQDIIVFTRDQHLYRVAVNISWAQPDRFHNYGTTHWWNILPLELHWLCQITDGRKWYPVSCAFGGVNHMFTGNKCPQNVRALRPLVETVIHEYRPWRQWWCWYDFLFIISCEKQLIRKALGRWIDKDRLSHDDILLSWKGHCIEFKCYANGIHSGLTPPGNNSWPAGLTQAEESPSLFTPLK